MARQKATENLVPVTGAISPELREAVEAHRWQHRQTTSDVVREALELWAKAKGIVIEKPAPTETVPAETVPAETVEAAKVEDKSAPAPVKVR